MNERHMSGAIPALLTTGLLLGLGTAVAASPEADEVTAAATPASLVERGRYLVTIAGCNDCHTPWHIGPEGPEPDMSRMLSGHPQALELPPPPVLPGDTWAAVTSATNTAVAGDWGVSYSANLTPDRETGLGKWTLRNFVETIRKGRRMGRGRELLPPMPWPMYRNMTDADLEAVFTFLQSIPAIDNRVPDPVLPEED